MHSVSPAFNPATRHRERRNVEFPSAEKPELSQVVSLSSVSPDVILCGWLGLKHQLTNFKLGVYQNIALRASPTAKSSVSPIHFTSFFSRSSSNIKWRVTWAAYQTFSSDLITGVLLSAGSFLRWPCAVGRTGNPVTDQLTFAFDRAVNIKNQSGEAFKSQVVAHTWIHRNVWLAIVVCCFSSLDRFIPPTCGFVRVVPSFFLHNKRHTVVYCRCMGGVGGWTSRKEREILSPVNAQSAANDVSKHAMKSQVKVRFTNHDTRYLMFEDDWGNMKLKEAWRQKLSGIPSSRWSIHSYILTYHRLKSRNVPSRRVLGTTELPRRGRGRQRDHFGDACERLYNKACYFALSVLFFVSFFLCLFSCLLAHCQESFEYFSWRDRLFGMALV